MKDTMTPKPPPYLPPTRGLRVLTFFCRPTGSQSIYRLSANGLQLVRMLRDAQAKS